MDTATSQEGIKTLRIELDFIGNSIKSLTPSREISLAITKLQESKMWLGKVLQEMKEPNPYPDSKNADNVKIESATDRSKENLLEQWNNSNYTHIQRVKDCRKRIDEQVPHLFKVFTLLGDNVKIDYKVSMFAKEAYMAAELSMMWLGMELGRIHDSGAIAKA